MSLGERIAFHLKGGDIKSPGKHYFKNRITIILLCRRKKRDQNKDLSRGFEQDVQNCDLSAALPAGIRDRERWAALPAEHLRFEQGGTLGEENLAAACFAGINRAAWQERGGAEGGRRVRKRRVSRSDVLWRPCAERLSKTVIQGPESPKTATDGTWLSPYAREGPIIPKVLHARRFARAGPRGPRCRAGTAAPAGEGRPCAVGC